MKKHIELGCADNKREMEGYESFGIDIIDGPCVDAVVNLGFEPIPFSESSIDLVQAYDVLEHIPKCVWSKEIVEHAGGANPYPVERMVRNTPFIYLMNDIYRVLKPNGIFIMEVPFSDEAFNRDPTHVNRFAKDWAHYFKQEDNYYANQGLITCDFIYKDVNYREYLWSKEDIMHCELIAIKGKAQPKI